MRIADAIDGQLGTFVGKVVACEGEPLVAPITGRTCACFDAFVRSHHRKTSRDVIEEELFGPAWEAFLAKRILRGTPFIIEDATGRALVDPRGAYVRLTHDFKRGGYDQDAGNMVLADSRFVEGVAAGERMEYGEGVLEVGEHVMVSGLVQKAVQTGDGLYRASADDRVRIVGAPDRPADITDQRAEIERVSGITLPRAREGALELPRGARQHVSGKIIAPGD